MKLICLMGFVAMICTQAVNAAAAEYLPIEKCDESNNFKSCIYMEIAGALQSMPKEKAVEQLRAWAGSGRYEMPVIIFCRMLFEAKEGKTFRRPKIGGPSFCGSLGDTSSSLSPIYSLFKLEPIALVDGVPFLVAGNYIVLGMPPEKASEYLEYCLGNLNWNTVRFQKANKKSLNDAYDKLVKVYFDGKLDKYDAAFLRKQIDCE